MGVFCVAQVSVNLRADCRAIETAVLEKLGATSDLYYLTFQDQPLEHGVTLSRSGVEQGSDIVINFRGRGGGGTRKVCFFFRTGFCVRHVLLRRTRGGSVFLQSRAEVGF